MSGLKLPSLITLSPSMRQPAPGSCSLGKKNVNIRYHGMCIIHNTSVLCSLGFLCVHREVFHVPKAILLVPKMYPSLRCHLHVINNDTGEEVPKFFNSVFPFTYTPNKVCVWYMCVYVYVVYVLYTHEPKLYNHLSNMPSTY